MVDYDRAMSQSDGSDMQIGCPKCSTTIETFVPPGPGIHEESDSNRLQGTETTCRRCDHELELYYY